MSGRLAVSSTGRNGQYIGTTRTAPPSAAWGSPTARRLNGTSDRIVGPRSNDLGATFLMVMSFWRGQTAPADDNQVSQRLFSQYCAGGTRVGLGLNRQYLSLVYQPVSGVATVVESRAVVNNMNQHKVGLLVTGTHIHVFMDGYQVIKVAANLRVPSSARVNVGSEADSRFFLGWVDDLALYTAPVQRPREWLNYYHALSQQLAARDVVPAAWGPQVGGAFYSDDNFTAAGAAGITPICRIAMEAAFRAEPEFPIQNIELQFTAGTDPSAVAFGWYGLDHNFNTQVLGNTPGSWRFTQGGDLIRNGAVVTTDLPAWQLSDIMGLRFLQDGPQMQILQNGSVIHTVNLPSQGPWTPAVQLGPNTVRLNSGLAWPYVLPLGFPGLYREAHSRLNTEFRNMKLADVVAPLADTDNAIRSVYQSNVVGNYSGTDAVAAGFTDDSLDVSRRVGGGMQITAAPHTLADDAFFFAIALSPEESDLVGDKIILESPGRWGLKLLDGHLFAWVGGVQVGSQGVALEAGKRYLLGVSSSPTGRLLVWSHVGYLLQSGDLIEPQTEPGTVWLGSGAQGINALAGRVSHAVLSSERPDQWKLDRLRRTYTWDAPNITGAIPNPITEYRVYEMSWWDALFMGLTPNVSNNYVVAVAAAPDETVEGFRMLGRPVDEPVFIQDDPRPATVTGLLQQNVTRLQANLQLSDFGDLTGIQAGDLVIVNDEYMRLDVINPLSGELTVARGVVDTVPVAHAAGSRVWFATNPGRILQPQQLNTLMEVKLLARSAMAELAEDMAPSVGIQMSGRLARPYPPANVQINDELQPGTVLGTMLITWGHRSKTNQGMTLVGWTEASRPLPAGVVYRVRAYDPVSGELLHESSTMTDGNYNLLVPGHIGRLQVSVVSIQGAYECWQVPQVEFDYDYRVVGLMHTQEGEPFATEDEQDLIGLQKVTALRAGSYSGQLPQDLDYDSLSYEELFGSEEEEEEEGAAAVTGVPISDFPAYTDPLQGPEIVPIVRGGENYTLSFDQLMDWISAQIPPGKSAYDLWLEDGNSGTLEDFFEAYRGYQGLNSNNNRRIGFISSASGAVVCDWEAYDEIRLRLTGSVTLTFTGAKDGQGCLLKLQQDIIGGHTVTLPSSVRYNALVPFFEMRPGPEKIDKLAFIFDNADSRYDLQGYTPEVE